MLNRIVIKYDCNNIFVFLVVLLEIAFITRNFVI